MRCARLTIQGLTLVYCMWHDSSNSHAFKSVGALTDCSIILYVMTERWPASRKYRDLFEGVKKSVLDAISEGKHTPGTAVISMKDDFQTSLQSLQVDNTFESMPEDLEQMMSDMTGETYNFWDDMYLNELGGGKTVPDSLGSESQMFSQNDMLWENHVHSWYGG